MVKSKALRLLIALTAMPMLNLPANANQDRAPDSKKEYNRDYAEYLKNRQNFHLDGILKFHNKYPHLHSIEMYSSRSSSYEEKKVVNGKVIKDIKVETPSFQMNVIALNMPFPFDIKESMKNTGYLVLDFNTQAKPLFGAKTKDIKIHFMGDGKRLSLSFYSQDLYVQLKEASLTKSESNQDDIRSINIGSATSDNASLSYLWTRKQDKTSLKIYADQTEIQEIVMPYFPIETISVDTTTATIVRFFSKPGEILKETSHPVTSFD